MVRTRPKRDALPVRGVRRIPGARENRGVVRTEY